MDQNTSSDYYMVASARFVNATTRDKVTGVVILHYSNSQGLASGPLPEGPAEADTYISMNQTRSIRYPKDSIGTWFSLIYMVILLVSLGCLAELYKFQFSRSGNLITSFCMFN